MAFSVPGDAIEQGLDLNHHLIHNPAATFFMRAEGDMEADQEVQPGDLLVIDRSVAVQDGSLFVAAIALWPVFDHRRPPPSPQSLKAPRQNSTRYGLGIRANARYGKLECGPYSHGHQNRAPA